MATRREREAREARERLRVFEARQRAHTAARARRRRDDIVAAIAAVVLIGGAATTLALVQGPAPAPHSPGASGSPSATVAPSVAPTP